MDILIALIIMLSIALVAGILLSLFSKLFFVEENPIKKEIRECLPGINCGACGYKGCDDYAAALCDGGVSPSLCIPGAQDVANKVAEIIGVKAEPFKDIVAFVACNGRGDATFKKAEYEGVKTCHAANMVYGGSGACSFGCLGFGDCAAACPSDAICVIDGVARVNTALCVGCGLCTRICPKNIIYMVAQNTNTVVMCSNKQKGAEARKACKNACIACKKCEKACPYGAITVKDNLATIDYSLCTGCGICVKECPTGCLKTVFFPNLPKGASCKEIVG